MSESARATRKAETALASYGRAIRGVVSQFWAGRIDFDQAFGLMVDDIRVGLRNNWFAGAAQCGIQPNELSPEERLELTSRTAEEQRHIAGFLTDIEANDKASGALLRPQLKRAEAWTLRATDIQNQARVMACGDKKLKWVWDPPKEHCVDCGKLNGKVKRASAWRRSGIQPQSHDLACRGFLCGCKWVPTNEPLSRGPLPKLVGP